MLCGVAALVLAGCGDETKSQDGDLKSTTSSTATTTTTAPTTTTTAPTATSGTTAAAAKITVPNVVGKDLQLAQDTMQAAGLYHLTSHDSTGQARLQVLDRNWVVTDQTPAAGSSVAADQLIDLGARKFTDSGQPCSPRLFLVARAVSPRGSQHLPNSDGPASIGPISPPMRVTWLRHAGSVLLRMRARVREGQTP